MNKNKLQNLAHEKIKKIKLSGMAYQLYFRFIDKFYYALQNKKNYIIYPITEIMNDLDISDKTATKYKNELIKNNLIKEKKRFRACTKYYLNILDSQNKLNYFKNFFKKVSKPVTTIDSYKKKQQNTPSDSNCQDNFKHATTIESYNVRRKYINTYNNKKKQQNTLSYSNCQDKNVVNFILNFQKELKNKYNFSLNYSAITNLLKNKGKDILITCLDKFKSLVDQYKRSGRKINSMQAIFIQFVKDEYKPNNHQINYVPQQENYKQRKYSDDDFYVLYDNLTPEQAKALYNTDDGECRSSKISQEGNYKQRKYDDNFFDSLYDNLKYVTT